MKKVLIANRGEIAVRVIRACREMGLSPVAVYSECDRTAPHVRYADEAYPIGPSAPLESYLRIDRIVDAARRAGADAVHPGYGFLSENEAFARAVRDAGLTFIGPSPEVIALMGSKTAARAAAQRAGVAVVPGADCRRHRRRCHRRRRAEAGGADGYPLLVKAVSGGGGKGMRTVHGPGRSGRRRAGRAVGSRHRRSATPPCTSSARLVRPRHVESPGARRPARHRPAVRRTRVFNPAAAPEGGRGNTVAGRLAGPAAGPHRGRGGRDAERRLQQRRHGRVPPERGRLVLLPRSEHAPAGRARHHGDGDGPRSGAVADPDRPGRAAERARRSIRDRLLVPHGHSIECRIYAEDPDNQFLPSPGRILDLREPAGPGVRIDSGIETGLDVPMFYDPMLVETGRLGRGSRRGSHRAAAPRARRVPRRRHQDDSPVLPVAARSAGRSPRAGFTRPTWTTCCRRGTASRSSKRRRSAQEIAAIAAAINSILTPPSARRPVQRPAAVEGSGTHRRTARLTNGRSRKGLWCDRATGSSAIAQRARDAHCRA